MIPWVPENPNFNLLSFIRRTYSDWHIAKLNNPSIMVESTSYVFLNLFSSSVKMGLVVFNKNFCEAWWANSCKNAYDIAWLLDCVQ